MLIALAILALGAVLFYWFDRSGLTPVEAVYYSWTLAFGEPPAPFPRAPALRVLYFAFPVLGMTIIVEFIVSFALLLRDRRQAERSWCVMMASSMSDHIVLAGLGRLGIRTWRLLRRLGESVVVIERNADCEFLEEVRRDGTPLILGDARREQLLVEANLAAAKSIIIATNDDLGNLEIALDARRLKPGIRVVLRMFDQNMADKIREGFNLHIAMSQSAMASPAFATAALDRSILNSFVVDNELIVMQRWVLRAGGVLTGRTIQQASAEHGIGFVQYKSTGAPPRMFPTPDTRLSAGDEVVVQGLFEKLGGLRKLAGEGV